MGKRRPLKYNFLFSVPNLCTLRVFHRWLVTANRVSDDADNSFLAYNGEERGSWRADGGGTHGWDGKSARESEPEAVLIGWLGWEGGGLKGDGWFADCGHFWSEHGGFDNYPLCVIEYNRNLKCNCEKSFYFRYFLFCPYMGERNVNSEFRCKKRVEEFILLVMFLLSIPTL